MTWSTKHDTFCCRISSNLLRPPRPYVQVSSSAPYSGTPSASTLPINVTDQVSHPYKATGKIVFCIFSSLRLYRALYGIFLTGKSHVLSKPLPPCDSARLPVETFGKIVCMKLVFIHSNKSTNQMHQSFSIEPDGCNCLVQFTLDVSVCVCITCLFGIHKFRVCKSVHLHTYK